MKCEIIQADESPLRLLEPGRENVKKRYRTALDVFFIFSKSRFLQVATKLQRNYYITVIRDGYVGHQTVEKYSKGEIIHPSC